MALIEVSYGSGKGDHIKPNPFAQAPEKPRIAPSFRGPGAIPITNAFLSKDKWVRQ